VEKISRELPVMLIPLVIVLLLTTYIPALSVWLPNLLLSNL
jgi:TRAP-type C4-dicarboxylate transport system permease large subunit